MPNDLTPRERAGAILSRREMQLLEDDGLTVVETEEYEALLTASKKLEFESFATLDYELYVESLGGPSRGDHLDAVVEGKWESNAEATRFTERLDVLGRVADAAKRYIDATARFSGTQHNRYRDMVNALEALEALRDGQATNSNVNTDTDN